MMARPRIFALLVVVELLLLCGGAGLLRAQPSSATQPWLHHAAWPLDTVRRGLVVEGATASRITRFLLAQSPRTRQVLDRLLAPSRPAWRVRITERAHHPDTDAPLQPQLLPGAAVRLWPSELDSLREAAAWTRSLATSPGRLVLRPVPGGAELLIELTPTAEFAWAAQTGADLEQLTREWAAILGHEIAGHADGLWRFYMRREGDKCPDPGPGRDGACVVAAENGVRRELGLPLRHAYTTADDDGFVLRPQLRDQLRARVTPQVPWCAPTAPRDGVVCVLATP